MDGRNVIRPLAESRKHVIYLVNFSGHKFTAEFQAAVSLIRTSIRYFHPNRIDYVQPFDSSIIQKIKDEWSQRWEAYKVKQLWKYIGNSPRGILPTRENTSSSNLLGNRLRL